MRLTNLPQCNILYCALWDMGLGCTLGLVLQISPTDASHAGEILLSIEASKLEFLAFQEPSRRGIHWWPVDSSDKGQVTREKNHMSWRHHVMSLPWLYDIWRDLHIGWSCKTVKKPWIFPGAPLKIKIYRVAWHVWLCDLKFTCSWFK